MIPTRLSIVLLVASVFFCSFIQAQQENDILEAISTCLQTWQWKDVILITDNKDFKPLIRRLSNVMITMTILPRKEFSEEFVDYVTVFRSLRIIAWCQLDYLKLVLSSAHKKQLLMKNVSWFFIFHEKKDFLSIIPFIAQCSREDSNVVSFFPAVGTWTYQVVRVIYHKFPESHVRYFPVAYYRKSTGLTLLPVIDTNTRLHDYQLKVAFIDYAPLMEFSSTPQRNETVKGYVSHVIADLSKILGFRYTYVKESSNTFGGLTNGSWDGIAGSVFRKEVDIGGSIAIHQKRLDILDFSSDVVRTRPVFAYRHPTVFSKSTMACGAYWKPFPVTVWALAILTWIVLSAIRQIISITYSGKYILFLRNMQKDVPKRKFAYLNITFRILQILDIFLLLCYTPKANEVRTSSSRIIILVKLGFVLLMSYSYTSMLISTKSVAKHTIPFETMDDIVKSGYGIGVLKSSVFQSALEASKNKIGYQLAWKSVSSDPSNFIKESKIGLKRVCEQKYAYLDSALGISSVHKPSCCFDMIKFRSATYLSLPFPKGSPLVEVFSSKILHLRAVGVFSRLRRKYVPSEEVHCDTDEKPKMSLGEAMGAFLVLGIGIILSLFVLYCEVMTNF